MVCALHSRWLGQKCHLPELAVHLDPGDHATQLDRIVFTGRAGEADQVVAENVPVATALETAHDAAAQVVLGAGDPENAAHCQVGQVGEIQVRLVEDDDFAGPHACAKFAGTEAVVFTGGADDGEAGQEGLQVQAEVTLGGGLATAMLGPVNTASNQLNGGGVHQMDGALEAEGELRTAATAEAGVELLEMLEDAPEEVFGHIWAGRSRLAVEKPFLLGPLAPRMAESGPEFKRKASQTSLRPRAWVSWAKIRLTT